MSRVFILPYKMGSESAKALSAALNCRRIYNDSRSRYRARRTDIIINWGNSTQSVIPENIGIINPPRAVMIASNKLYTFQRFTAAGVPTCAWTTNILEWVNETGVSELVFARKVLTGSCGRGIQVFDIANEVTPIAPLYTKQYKAKREYRVHVAFGKVIDFVKKGKRRGREEEPNLLVRNHESGWIFIREGVELPEEVGVAAIAAITALGLDFGAVDIGYNHILEQTCCVYEVNCACGMSVGSTTAKSYAKAFKEALHI